MEKTYYLVFLNFGKNDDNTYAVYSYQKNRRFTARQAWNHIYHGDKNTVATGNLSKTASIDAYWKIIEKLNLDKKVCDRYCNFANIGW